MEINKTSTQKLDTNVQVAQATSTKSATKTAETTSFKDAISLMSDIETPENNTAKTTQNTTTNASKESPSNATKDFQFISTTTSNNTISNKKLGNENLSESEKLNIHKKADKELTKEIVLVNNKIELKNSKNENQLAQVSTAIKSDKEIETEKNDKSKSTKHRSKDSDLLDLAGNGQNQQSDLNNNDNNLVQISDNVSLKQIDNDLVVLNKEVTTIKNANIANDNDSVALNKEKSVTNVTDKLHKSSIAEDLKITNVTDKFHKSSIAEDLKITNVTDKFHKGPIVEDLKVKNAQKVDNDEKIIKDIAQGVQEITPDSAKNSTKDMKVITFAPISPIQELQENLTTNKTNDIVKFIDANLETTGSNKASKSKATSSVKKSEEKAIKMTEADAKFFQNLVENNNQVAQDAKATDMANQATLKDVQETHSEKISKSLLNALKESQENNKSFRVDFDKDLSVILKVNRDGKISAEFLPGDAAVEQYLKSNIPLLKQKFADEGLEYENLSYRDQAKKDKEEKRNNRNNKENGYE